MGPAGTKERSSLIEIDPPPSPDRLTLTISAGFATGAVETLPEPIDQASRVADAAMDSPLKDKLLAGSDKCGSLSELSPIKRSIIVVVISVAGLENRPRL